MPAGKYCNPPPHAKNFYVATTTPKVLDHAVPASLHQGFVFVIFVRHTYRGHRLGLSQRFHQKILSREPKNCQRA
jgi:hypothetical protein